MLPKKPIKTTQYYAYLKYSGLAFQLAAVILLGVVLGRYLEGLLELEKPIIQVLLILVFFVGFVYKLYIQTLNDK